MVLASIISEQKRKEGFRQGVKHERKRSNAKMRALAEKYGIPEDDLPIEPDNS